MQRLLLVLAILLINGIAHAGPNWYLGAGVTQAHGDLQLPPIPMGCGGAFGPCPTWSIDATSGKGFVGWRPIRPFAVEVDYVDFGSTDVHLSHGNVHTTGEAIPVYAMGYLPLPLPGGLELFGKAGAARWEQRHQGYTGDEAANGIQIAWGAGVQAHFGPAGARFEYERFSVAQSSTGAVYVYSLSAYVRLPFAP
jgi:hypothetical protein